MSSTDLKKELDKALAETERLRRENEELKLQVKKSLYVNKESPDQVADAVSFENSSTTEGKFSV